MPTTSTVVSRLELVHPDLNYDGGSGLHSLIRNGWTKIGDNMNSRFFTADAVANLDTVDFDHNFKTSFDELRINLYLRDTGTGELTRIKIGSTPDIEDFLIEETVGLETTSVTITNNSGATRDLAVVIVHGKGAEVLNDLDDVDTKTVPPEDGQSLVWDGVNFVPGASGDASFKIQSVDTAGFCLIKGGYLIDNQGREFATYDGVGTASTDFAVDITVDLDNLEISPTVDQTYYLYISLTALQSQITQSDTERLVYGITESQLVLLSTAPDATNTALYIPLGFVRYDTTTWSDTVFGTTAFRRHSEPSVAVSPVVYTVSLQTIGEVGAKNNAYGPLEIADFPNNTTLDFWHMDGDGNSSNGGVNLTPVNSPQFVELGFFGRKDLPNLSKVSDSYFSSTDAFFNATAELSVGLWVRLENWASNIEENFITDWGSGNLKFGVQKTPANLISFFFRDSVLEVSPSVVACSASDFTGWHHFAFVYNLTTITVYVDGNPAGQLSITLKNSAVINFFVGNIFGSNVMNGQVQDVFFHKGTALTSSEICAVYSKRFTPANQLRAGHVYTLDTFSTINPLKLSYWNLNQNINDGSGNGRNLTAIGSTFAGTDIFGVLNNAALSLAASQGFTVTGSFCNDGTSFAFGGWYNLARGGWDQQETQFVGDPFFGSLGDRNGGSFEQTISWEAKVIRAAPARIEFNVNSVANVTSTSTYNLPTGVIGWHHLVFVFNDSKKTLEIYFDGLLKNSAVFNGTARLIAPVSILAIGGRINTSVLEAPCIIGNIEQAFYVCDPMNALQINKTYSSKINHLQNIVSEKQTWNFNAVGLDGNGAFTPFNNTVIVDKATSNLYLNLSTRGEADFVQATLANESLSPSLVSVQTFDRTFTSDPDLDANPISTNLASDPTSIEVLKLISGAWSVVADGNSLVEVANTGSRLLTGDISSTTPTSVSPVRIVISSTPSALSVSEATSVQKGIVALENTGFTKFVGGTHPERYESLTAAFVDTVPGDSILLVDGYTASAAETLSVSDVTITFMPSQRVEHQTARATGCLVLDADRIRVKNLNLAVTGSATIVVNAFIQVTANAQDCAVEVAYLEANNATVTVTQGVELIASSARNYINASINTIAGTVTAPLSDAGTNNTVEVRG